MVDVWPFKAFTDHWAVVGRLKNNSLMEKGLKGLNSYAEEQCITSQLGKPTRKQIIVINY